MSSPTFSHDLPTLDTPLPIHHSSSAPVGACCRVAMCEGTSPHLSTETQSLLRSRLRSAALLLGLGFSAFFVRNLFYTDYNDAASLFLLIFHGLVSVTLLLIGGGLCHKCTFKQSTLRAAELAIFGLPALFFVAMHWLYFKQWQAGTVAPSYMESPAPPWLLLILIYSLFIPNTWQRAAWILGAFVVIPSAVLIAAWLKMNHVYDAISFFNITTIVMILTLAAICGVWGVYTIGRLRREAFEARQLGQYRLKRLIGAGGMGEVYLAEHQLMKRPVAIKLIKPSRAADPQALARFEREVQATARLSHWNTIEIFDYGRTDDGTFYYVMEYLPGKNLADLVNEHGPLPPERVISLLQQTCEGLAEAHGMGLIHRDIKPGNIFAAERGGVFDVAKLLDFGLAKPIARTGDIALTQEGSLTGSPLFMAPEQAMGEGEPDARSDVYALGGVGYYLLTGKPPFEADNPIKILMAHARDAVVPPSQLRPDVPHDLEQVVLRCLEKDPAARYPDTLELAAALAACASAGRWTRTHARQWWTSNGHGSVEQPSLERAPSPAVV